MNYLESGGKILKFSRYAALALLLPLCSSCAFFRVPLFSQQRRPFQEYTLQGTGKEKVALIHVRGFISDEPRFGLLRDKPSMVQEFVSQLRIAESDADVKGIVLKIDSGGGTVTGSDIIYHADFGVWWTVISE